VNDLDHLATDLDSGGLLILAGVREDLDVTGMEIRDDARTFAPGAHGGSAKHYPAAITHEVNAAGLTCEIGPEKKGQGSLGHLFEYGVESRGLPPQMHLGPALDRGGPAFDERLAARGERSLW
jgi:hypothetical protein